MEICLGGAYLALLAPLHDLLTINEASHCVGMERQAVEWARSDVGCLTLALVVMSSLYPKKAVN
jgi:hypothetical protein